MTYSTIVSDWNGTLFEYKDDSIQNRKIGQAVLYDAIMSLMHGNLYKIQDILALCNVRKALKRKIREYSQGRCRLADVYEIFNSQVLSRTDESLVEHVLDEYSTESASKVDGRMIRPIRKNAEDGKRAYILSVSCRYSISNILEKSGYDGVFSDITAHDIVKQNGKVRFSTHIYESKPSAFEKIFITDNNIQPCKIVYIGDSSDDEPVAKMIPKGNFIVPFLADDDFKNMMASEYNAFVPENEHDLDRYLQLR